MDLNKLNYLNFNNFKNNNKNDIEKQLKPNLIDPGVKYYFKYILNECHNYKLKNYNFFYNLFLFIFFCIILFIVLYSKYKGGRTKEEEYKKYIKDKEYIMSKLVYYNKMNLENQQNIKNNLITNIPNYSNNVEANLLYNKMQF